jgi:hypothetical protein
MEQRSCEQCGESFYPASSPSQIRPQWGRFCSKRCAGRFLHPSQRLALTCMQCGIVFHVQPSCARAKYCSKVCHNQSMVTLLERVCSWCGTTFTCDPSQARLGRGKHCSRACHGQGMRGERSATWKGGRRKTETYVIVMTPEGRCMTEHRFVMQQLVGRRLRSDEHVHHINGIKNDNRPENLRLMTHQEHSQYHGTQGRWARDYNHCVRCLSSDRPHRARGLCSRCYQTENRQDGHRSVVAAALAMHEREDTP